MGLELPARVFYKHLLTPDLRKVLVDLNKIIHNRDLIRIEDGDDYEYEI